MSIVFIIIRICVDDARVLLLHLFCAVVHSCYSHNEYVFVFFDRGPSTHL